jgi:hypothetical protein
MAWRTFGLASTLTWLAGPEVIPNMSKLPVSSQSAVDGMIPRRTDDLKNAFYASDCTTRTVRKARSYRIVYAQPKCFMTASMPLCSWFCSALVSGAWSH